jgi:hypothetical protein
MIETWTEFNFFSLIINQLLLEKILYRAIYNLHIIMQHLDDILNIITIEEMIYRTIYIQ